MPNTLPHDSNILVCDAKKALILRNIGSAIEPQLTVETTLHAPENPMTSDQGTDAPGKVRAPNGRRSAVEPVDHHMLAEIAFAEDVAGAIEAHTKSRPAPLIVVAPPKMLASLRNYYGHSTKAALKREVDKDLTKLPVPEILKNLRQD